MNVAFIDLLGFSAATDIDPRVAEGMLMDYESTLFTKINDSTALEENKASSFNHFLSLSDSIFIASDQPALFVLQLSSFIADTFVMRQNTFANPNNSDPKKVVVTDLPAGTQEETIWFPALFRGGVGYGKLNLLPSKWRINGKSEKSHNIIGKAVLEAVGMEKNAGQLPLGGPRITCSEEFVEKVNRDTSPYAEKAKTYIGKCFDKQEANKYEIYWPMDYFDDDDPIRGILSELPTPLLAALNFWTFHIAQNPSLARHYHGFTCLLVASARKRYPKDNDKIEQMTRKIAENTGAVAKIISNIFNYTPY